MSQFYKVVVDGEVIEKYLTLNDAKRLAKYTFKETEKNFFSGMEYAKGGNTMRKNIHERGFVDEEVFVVEVQEI